MPSLLQTKRFGWAVTLALVTLGALLAYWSGTRYLSAVHGVEHTLAVESAINATLSLLKDAETGQRGYILTGDASFLEPYETAQREIPAHVERLVSVIEGDPAQRPRLERLSSLIEQKQSFIERTLSFRREDQADQALALVRSGLGKQLMDNIRIECKAMLDHEAALLSVRKTEARAAEAVAVFGLGIGSLLTILFALFSWATVHRDVAALKQSADDLLTNETHYRLLTEQGSDLVRLLDLSGVVTYVSPSVERLLGYSVEEYLALAPVSLVHPDEQAKVSEILLQIKSGLQLEGLATYRIRHRSGEYRWFEVRWAARLDQDAKPVDIHTSGRDVDARIAADAQLNAYAAELRNMSLRDELTKLYNRRGFLEIGAHGHSQALRDQRPAALLFVDLNGMKRINDEQGHDTGDQALVDAGQVLTSSLREADVIARLGGDEFVAFVLDFEPLNLDPLLRRLRQEADSIVAKKQRRFRLSLSVGAAYLPVGSNHSVQELLDQADAAMYEQKKARRAAGGISIIPPNVDGDPVATSRRRI